MLDGLNEVPWDRLNHAYGSAADVPGLLRALATVEGDPWENYSHPLREFFGNIWHQGTIYPATPYAVPHLIELAAGPQTQCRTMTNVSGDNVAVDFDLEGPQRFSDKATFFAGE